MGRFPQIILEGLKVKSESCSVWQTLCNPMDYTIHGILQARILEWVTFPLSRGSSQSQASNPGLLHCRRILYQLSYLMDLVL